MMNMQELSTLAQYNLPVKVFILNNQWMGMVRQWQELMHGGRYSESYSEALPDFVKLAEAFQAVGLRADVTIFDRSIKRLAELDAEFRGSAKTAFSTQAALESAVRDADVVIGAVLVPGAAAPKLVTREMVKTMKEGSVLVDIAIDQGGCFETSRPTTHDDPTYIVDGVVHYCVANMPGAVARTSTLALTNATLPFTRALADKGTKKALNDDPFLAEGLNVAEGKVTYKPVADDLGLEYRKPDWLTSI